MLEQNMEDELSDFDLKHFCDGNPVYCYYFRLPHLQLEKASSATEGQFQNDSAKAKTMQWKDWGPTKPLTKDILSPRDRFPSLQK